MTSASRSMGVLAGGANWGCYGPSLVPVLPQPTGGAQHPQHPRRYGPERQCSDDLHQFLMAMRHVTLVLRSSNCPYLGLYIQLHQLNTSCSCNPILYDTTRNTLDYTAWVWMDSLDSSIAFPAAHLEHSTHSISFCASPCFPLLADNKQLR